MPQLTASTAPRSSARWARWSGISVCAWDPFKDATIVTTASHGTIIEFVIRFFLLNSCRRTQIALLIARYPVAASSPTRFNLVREITPARDGRPAWMRCQLLHSALLDLLLDHPVQVAANPVDIQPLRQRLLLLHGVQCGFHDVCRVEARREGTRRKFL